MIGKAVPEMEMTNIDYMLDIFRTLSTELPDQMLYRENESGMELKAADSIGSSLAADMQDSGWNLIGRPMTEAA